MNYYLLGSIKWPEITVVVFFLDAGSTQGISPEFYGIGRDFDEQNAAGETYEHEKTGEQNEPGSRHAYWNTKNCPLIIIIIIIFFF